MSLTNENKIVAEGKGPLWVRLITISVAWVAIALVLAGYLLSLVFRDALETNFDERLNSMLDNLIGVSSSENSMMTNLDRPMADLRFEQPYSGWYWQISADGLNPFRSRSLWDVDLDADHNIPLGSLRYRYAEGPEGQHLRVAERAIIIQGSETVYLFAVAVDTAEIDEQTVRFDKILFIGLGVLGVGLIAASLLQVFLGLKPLGHIKQSLSKVRSGDAEYLPIDFPKEIQPLADELNALLDHNNEVIVRSRVVLRANLVRAGFDGGIPIAQTPDQRSPGAH